MIKPTPFYFYTERRLVILTGLRARNLLELLMTMKEIPGSSIFYHTHHLFLSHHFEKPVVYNEFAIWTSRAIQEEALAERMSAVDLRLFTSIRELRNVLVSLIQEHLETTGGRARDCLPGDEFHFCRSKSFILPTGVVASDVPDFFAKMSGITNVSLYFHFLEARLRLGRQTNDFSQWLESCGEQDLAQAINSLDPYILTLDELKEEILQLGR
jgi:uncharacterized protein DUF5752